MAKRTAAEAEVRRQFSKTARIVRKQYQTLGEAAPNSSVLAKIDPEEIIGLKEREASGYATDTKTLKRLNNWMQNIIDKELLSVDAHKRSVQNAIDTMQAQGHT